MTSAPKKLSILVVVYNAEKLIEFTLDRILEQKTEEVELIVLDGNSSDGTLEVIASYKQDIEVFKSEPDDGIYQAMNKALRLSCGEFVWFINAGDAPAPDAVEMILSQTVNSDVIYGETIFINEQGASLGLRSEFTTRKLPKNLSASSFLKGQVVSHQAFVPRGTLIEPYNQKYQISADIDWQISILKKAKHIVRISRPLALYLHGGTSKQHAQQAWKERYVILKEHFGWLRTIFAHMAMSFRALSFLITQNRND